MQTYKRSIQKTRASLLLSVVMSAVSFLVAMLFLSNMALVLLVTVGVLLALLYITMISENIYFELERSTLRYYQKNRLRQEFDLAETSARCTMGGKGLSPRNIGLYLSRRGEEGEYYIDCTPLGKDTFQRLFSEIERIALPAES